MDNILYEMIFKRKSFHLFRNIGNEHISDAEIKEIEGQFTKLKPLVEDIKVKIKIVKDGASCRRGQEYCILFYSEKKENYLQNIGYIGEQLDLYLVSKNIGTLWFGIGKVDEKQIDGLDFVIMIAIAKVDSADKFRKDMYKSKRKELNEIWSGDNYLDIADIVRFAPSACNTQPWNVEASANELKVYRYRKEGKRGIMPKNRVIYYNQIDIGIFLFFLELCLEKNGIAFNRQIFTEENHENEKNLTAIYNLRRGTKMNIKDYGFKGNIEDKTVARIIATHKDRYEIVCNNGQGYARIKRGRYYDNPDSIYPTTGDFVLIEWNDTGDSMIYETLKRESSFSRTASSSDRNRELHNQHEQLVASNFDYVFIMQSLNNNFNLNRIERYLSLAWESGGIPVIVLTKSDLVSDAQEYIDEVQHIAFGVDVYAVSCVTKDGIDDIKKFFSKGNTIVFLGSSGVGKSTLVNTLYGEEVMKTSEIREDDSRGRHTTTSRNLIMLPNGAMIIDTPGMRELGMWDAESGISKTFQDVEQYIGMCKFSDCTHTNEPGCRILEAIRNGELQQERYEQYLKLQKESQYNTNSEQYLKDKKEKFKAIAKMNRQNKK